MKIRKVNDKPLDIHTKESPRLHVKKKQEIKIKGRNVLTIAKVPGIADRGAAKDVTAKKSVDIAAMVRKGRRKKKAGYAEREEICQEADKERGTGRQTKKPDSSTKRTSGKISGNVHASVSSCNHAEKSSSGMLQTVGAVGAKTALEQMEGGDELYDSCMVMDTLTKPARSAARSGQDLYRGQAAQRVVQKIKKARAGGMAVKRENTDMAADIYKAAGQGAVGENLQKPVREVPKKTAKDIPKTSARDAAKKKIKKTSRETEKKAAKEAAKTAARTSATAAGTAVGTAATGAGGVLFGIAAGEAVGRELDKKDMRNSARNRMIQLFVSKLRQEEKQDSIAKALKDIATMRFFVAIKYIMKYTAFFLTGVLSTVAFIALPVIVMLAVIYNSPFAIFFPSISSAETTQKVLAAYVAEFDRDVELEMLKTKGYDKVEKIYVNFSGEGAPDNYCDILAVYMVRHGNGDTATDMTDKAKQNLQKVFRDMCSYRVSKGTETEIDDDGDTITYQVKYVNITLMTYQDMISVYGFDAEEQEMLVELMKPENLAMIGYDGPGGGQEISPDRYQAVMDAVSGENGKGVMEFALSKVGCPYSQELRDSGTHFDCSSLAYYAWHHAGVNISFYGSTSAAAEGQLCHDNDWLVHYGDMQPGDLIFYSYEKNGRFMNISHVAIYAGNGMVVEAANSRLGVVYRPVQSRSSIVMIGRPR